MGRQLPAECPHGYIFDWGDFGCQELTCYGTCALCPPERCPEGCNDAEVATTGGTGYSTFDRADEAYEWSRDSHVADLLP